jgi:hypothetical protein
VVSLHTYGRTDTAEFFTISGLYRPQYRGWTHHPALVFLVAGDEVTVRAVDSPSQLAKYPDETPVMQQWPGRHESHFFRFTVGDARPYLPGLHHPWGSEQPQFVHS